MYGRKVLQLAMIGDLGQAAEPVPIGSERGQPHAIDSRNLVCELSTSIRGFKQQMISIAGEE